MKSTSFFISAVVLAAFFIPQKIHGLDGTAETERWSESYLTRQVLSRELLAEISMRQKNKASLKKFFDSKATTAIVAKYYLAKNEMSRDFFRNSFKIENHDLFAKLPVEKRLKSKKARNLEKLLVTAFPQEASRKSIQSLLGKNITENCKVKPLAVRQYVNHQKKIIAKNQQAYAPDLIKYVKIWKPVRVHCLLVTLMKKQPRDDNYDYLALALTLQKFHPKYQKDVFLLNVLATRYLASRQYAESLRFLYELQKNDPRYKELYRLVQRQYSLMQKGKGEVSIKSL